MNVNIFSAGDHGHETPVDADKLISELLEKANLNIIGLMGRVWECRIDKMEKCDPLTPPIRVINYKPYGIILKVKSEINNTRCQIMTLQLPEGLPIKVEDLFTKLKDAEKSVSRAWRKESTPVPIVNNTSTPVPITPGINNTPVINNTPGFLTPAPVVFDNLVTIHKDEAKLITVLSKVDELSKRNIRSKTEFLASIRTELGWDEFLLRFCSMALNSLVKHNYLMEVIGVDGKTIKGFTLTDRGTHVLLQVPISPDKIDKTIKINQEQTINYEYLLKHQSIVQELATISNKFKANTEKKAELQLEIERIDFENQEIGNQYVELMKKLKS